MMMRETSSSWRFDRFTVGLLIVFLCGHLALALLVPDGAARMLVGDRAGDRVRALNELLAQADLDQALRLIFRIGSPGDWILFAPTYWLGGSYGVMIQSIVLYAVGLLFFYRLCLLLVPVRLARMAVIAWALLPATLFHPHAFVSEAICNPLLIMLVYFLVHMEVQGTRGWQGMVSTGLLAGILAFVRHIYLVLPLGVAAWLIIFRPQGLGRLRNVWGVLALSFLFTAGWLGLIALTAGRYELGRSIGGLEANLFLRAERMAVMGALDLPQSYLNRSAAAGQELRTLLPLEFIGFASAHPLLFAKTAASDALNLIVNPGVAMLAGRYLGLFDLGERNYRDLNKWREAREQQGPMGVVRLLWETSPTGFVFNLVGGIVWVGFLGIALIGCWHFTRDLTLTPAVRALLLGLVAYAVVLTSATAGYTRWDHRSGIEFVLALWFAIGWVPIARRLSMRSET